MIEQSRTGRCVIERLRRMAEGRPGSTPAPTRANDVLARATGYRVAMPDKGVMALLAPDGAVVEPREDGTHHLPAQLRADAWLREGPMRWEGRPRSLPAGAVEIAERLGLRMGALLAMHEVLGHVLVTGDAWSYSVYGNIQMPSVAYGGRGVRWRDGVVAGRGHPLPRAALAAAAGQRLGRHLVEDPVIADRVVRVLCAVDHRERRLRAVTTDHGRRTLVGG